MADGALLEAVRGLRLAEPELGPKPLLAKLREHRPAQPDWVDIADCSETICSFRNCC